VTAAPRPARPGYPGTTVAAGVLATLFFPLISLIVALVLVDGSRIPHGAAT
jgi:hypothetical protein